MFKVCPASDAQTLWVDSRAQTQSDTKNPAAGACQVLAAVTVLHIC